MALSHSPRKHVPLASEDDYAPRQRTRSLGNSRTKRVFLCGVVVEGCEEGRELPYDVQDLIASLGEPLDLGSDSVSLDMGPTSRTNPSQAVSRTNNPSALNDLIKELVSTERTYVTRLRMLKHDYADPLRKFAKHPETMIIDKFTAKHLFANIDSILPVNEAFLEDLEKMERPGGPGIGDVALKHFRERDGFQQYKIYYSNREEAMKLMNNQLKSTNFEAYIERIKYSAPDAKNRVGLSELVMEPVQRIPRYTLLFRTMMKFMAANDPQRIKLAEADQIASRIALAETDEKTKHATIMYGLAAAVEGFPANIVSHTRHLVDHIDVLDVPSADHHSPTLSSANGASPQTLHCTLLLFDDKLVIIKRPVDKDGWALAGIDQLDRAPPKKGSGFLSKKSGLVCKGVVDVVDVVATEVGGADFHLYLEKPPHDDEDRWSQRFRSLSVVFPPSPVYLDPSRTESAKRRFLENLWDVQAKYRTKKGQSVILRGEEREVEDRGGRVTVARTYYNVYTRTGFLKEEQKTKVVLHVDAMGTADVIPFGMRAPPYVVIRVQPMAGELARFKVTSSVPDDEEPEEDIMQTSRIPERIVHTIHQLGLFKFSTGHVSRPTTPTANARSRNGILSLDVISRNLGEILGGSMNGSRRSRTMASRSSTLASTVDSGGSRFSRSNSTTTASLSTDDDRSAHSGGSRPRTHSLSRGAKKLIKRAKSPFTAEPESEPDVPSPRRYNPGTASGHGRARSLSTSRDEEEEDEEEAGAPGRRRMDESERDLAMRLELARRNSQSQHGPQVAALSLEIPFEETIYEEDPSPSRPFSRTTRSLPAPPQTERPAVPRARSPDTIRPASTEPEHRASRAMTRQSSSDRRPRGPRSPSPLPPPSPLMAAAGRLPSSFDPDETIEAIPPPLITPSQQAPPVTPLPRSKRQPFEPTGNAEVTPKAAELAAKPVSVVEKPPSVVEPLSIKKKTSVRSQASTTTTTTVRRSQLPRRTEPVARMAFSGASATVTATATTGGSPKLVSAQAQSMQAKFAAARDRAHVDRVIRLMQTTKEDLESSHRAVKRIRLTAGTLTSVSPVKTAIAELERPASPSKAFRTPQRSSPSPVTKEAQARMDEMHKLIGKRVDGTPRTPRMRPMSVAESTSSSSRLADNPAAAETGRAVEDLAFEAEGLLGEAMRNTESLASGVQELVTELEEKSDELEKTKLELQSSKRQTELVKNLLSNCREEVDGLYEAFNNELEHMYDDAALEEDEAWGAMARGMREAKQAQMGVQQENSHLKRRIAELEFKQTQWETLLRKHKLIP